MKSQTIDAGITDAVTMEGSMPNRSRRSKLMSRQKSEDVLLIDIRGDRRENIMEDSGREVVKPAEKERTKRLEALCSGSKHCNFIKVTALIM